MGAFFGRWQTEAWGVCVRDQGWRGAQGHSVPSSIKAVSGSSENMVLRKGKREERGGWERQVRGSGVGRVAKRQIDTKENSPQSHCFVHRVLASIGVWGHKASFLPCFLFSTFPFPLDGLYRMKLAFIEFFPPATQQIMS